MAPGGERVSDPYRQDTPAVASVAYLNTGTAGPLLSPVAAAMATLAQEELLVGRVGAGAWDSLRATSAAARSDLGRLVGAQPGEIALTHHTTEGMNIVTWGLDWRPGDRVVTTSLEHGGGLLPLYQLHRRFGVAVDFAAIGRGGADQTLEAIGHQLERPARLLVLSHVTYGTGAVLPLAEITVMAHERGVLVAVDGAQSVGAIPVDVAALGVDFYAFPGQKWLCGPEGTGGLYVRRDHLDDLAGTFVGFSSVDHDRYRADDPESLAFVEGAARYEVGSLYRPGIAGLAEAARWHLGVGARLDATGRIHTLAAHALTAVAEGAGADLLTPALSHAGLVCFTVPGIDPTACVAYLADRGVAVRSIPENGALRLSCGFFNTTEEVDRALGLIAEYRLRS